MEGRIDLLVFFCREQGLEKCETAICSCLRIGSWFRSNKRGPFFRKGKLKKTAEYSGSFSRVGSTGTRVYRLKDVARGVSIGGWGGSDT